MAQIAGVIRVNEGVVLGNDSFSLKADSNIVKLNDKIAVLCVDDFLAGASFCRELAKTASGTIFDGVITEAKKILENSSNKYKGKLLTLIFVGYDEHGAEKPFHVIKFNGQKTMSLAVKPTWLKRMIAKSRRRKKAAVKETPTESDWDGVPYWDEDWFYEKRAKPAEKKPF